MENKNTKKIPVILDTDIGDDIDDTWAVSMLMNSPELDVKLILTEYGDTENRAKITAKMLEETGRVDIPIGIGIKQSDRYFNQLDWAKDYSLRQYPGRVHYDGIRAAINIIMGSQEPVTVIGIGPLTNIAAALDQEPRIAERARFVGMQGSIRTGYNGAEQISAEYNVKVDTDSCRKVFDAPWEVTITPVDTCGLIRLKGELYQSIYKATNPEARVVLENYKAWSGQSMLYMTESTVLFDTVAVYLAFSEELLNIEELGINVNVDGFTIIDETARKIRCATSWKSDKALEDFKELLVKRITGERQIR